MNHTMIGGPTGAVELHDGILYLRWASGAVIEEQDVRAAMAALHSVGQGRVYPVLAEMTTTAWLSCRARKVLSGPCQATRIALLGSSPVDRIIASFFLSRYSQPYTARF